MVRYKTIFLLFITVIITGCSGPIKVYDLIGISIMVKCHEARQEDYKEIKSLEVDKTLLQRGLLNKQQEELSVITNKLKKRYTSVQQIIHQVVKIPHAISLIKDCRNYQKNIIDMVKDEPELINIVIKTQIEVAKKTKKMFKYIYSNILFGGLFNLMTNEQRLKMTDYVVNELRGLRELLYGVDIRLKKAHEALKVEALLEKYNNSLFLMNKKEKSNLIKGLEVW